MLEEQASNWNSNSETVAILFKYSCFRGQKIVRGLIFYPSFSPKIVKSNIPRANWLTRCTFCRLGPPGVSRRPREPNFRALQVEDLGPPSGQTGDRFGSNWGQIWTGIGRSATKLGTFEDQKSELSTHSCQFATFPEKVPKTSKSENSEELRELCLQRDFLPFRRTREPPPTSTKKSDKPWLSRQKMQHPRSINSQNDELINYFKEIFAILVSEWCRDPTHLRESWLKCAFELPTTKLLQELCTFVHVC